MSRVAREAANNTALFGAWLPHSRGSCALDGCVRFLLSAGARSWPTWDVLKVWILRCMADSTRCSWILLAYSFQPHMFMS